MAMKKRKKVGKKSASTKSASKKRTKREDEEPEDDEEEEGVEQEAEQDVEDEVDDDEVDETVTGKTVAGLASSNYQLPSAGDWTFRMKKHEVRKPDSENDRPGGFLVTFEVLDGPIDEPEDGFNDHTEFFATKWAKGTELDSKKKQRTQIGKQQLSRYITTCLGEIDPDEEMTWGELLRECVGTELVATAVEKDGYVNVRSYKLSEE